MYGLLRSGGVKPVYQMRYLSSIGFICWFLAMGCTHRASYGLPNAQESWKDPALRAAGLGLGNLRFATGQSTLPSGLRIGHEQTSTNGMVGIVITIGSGATNDPAGQEGVAHFVEHVVFRSKHDRGVPLDVRMKLTGATGINASTSPDATTFYAFVPWSGFATLVKELNLMLSRPIEAIEEVDAATEREVIKNELRQRDETGLGGQMRSWTADTLLPATHPYRRSIGGSLETVDKLDLSAATAFAGAHYKPNNTSIMIVAEESFATVLDVVKKSLDPAWAGSDAAVQTPRLAQLPGIAQDIPAAPKEGAVTHYAAVDAPTLMISWRIPSLYSEGGHISQIVSAPAALDELRTAAGQLGAVQRASVWASHYLQTTIISCVVELNDPLAWQDVAKSIKNFYTERFSPYTRSDWQYVAARAGSAYANQEASNYSRYLASIRQRTTAEFLFSSESYVSRIHQMAGFLHFENNLKAFSAHIAQIKKTSYREVASILPSYLAESHARAVFIHEKPSASVPNVSGTGVVRDNVLAQVSELPGEGAVLSSPPRTRKEEAYAGTQKVTFPNGLTVIALRKVGYPTVTAALAFRSGWAASTPPAAERLVRILEQFRSPTSDDAGLRVEAANTADLSADYVVAGRSNMPHALALLANNLTQTDVIYDWGLMTNSFRNEARKASTVDPDNALAADIMRGLYPGSNLGHSPSFNDFRLLEGGAVNKWLKRSRHPSNAVLVIAGDLDPPTALKWAARIFGQWRGSKDDAVAEPVIAAALPPKAPKRVFVREANNDRPQVEISLACRLPQATSRSEATYDLLSGVVGGWLATRLREEAGLSYGVSGGVSLYRGGATHMALTVAVDRTHLTKALRIIGGHWDAFASRGFDRGGVSQIRWNLATLSNFGSTTSAGLAYTVASAVARGFAPEHADHYRDDLLAVGDSDLRDAFATCAATTIFGLVGDAGAINSSLAAIGLQATTPAAR